MDTSVLVAIGGGLTGLGGLAALLNVFASSRTAKKQNETTSAGLASSLNATAQDWVKYIDGKFNEVSDELSEFKATTKARDTARAVLHQAHRAWDFDLKGKLEEVTGEQIADPPPLDLDP